MLLHRSAFYNNRADRATYNEFMNALRTALKSDRDLIHGFLLLRRGNETNPSTNRFLLVTITALDGSAVTFGIEVVDVYIIAYKIRGKSQRHFFSDTPTAAFNRLFTDAQHRYDYTMSTNYGSLQGTAGTNRADIDLGIMELDRAISYVAGNTPIRGINFKTLAKSIIVCVEMIAEAARFSYMQELVRLSIKEDEYLTFRPDPTVMNLMNAWKPISKRIQIYPGGDFSAAPIEITRRDGKSKFSVNKASNSRLHAFTRLIKGE